MDSLTPGQTRLAAALDGLIARAHAAHPGVEYSFWMSSETALLVPWDNDEAKMIRTVNGRVGYYRAASYHDHEIVTLPSRSDTEVAFVPLVGSGPGSGTAAHFSADLETGAITVR